MNNTLSVIIPVYNCERTIIRLLDSILAGSIIPNEIILVNDGSTDKSNELIMNYSQKYSFFISLSQDHKGVSAARNLGLSKASGNWISFLDADDYIEPDMFRLMLNSVNEASYEVDGCICGYYTDKGNRITPYTMSHKTMLSSKDLMEAMFTDDSVRGFLFTRLFRKNLLNNISFAQDISHCEDLLFQTLLFASYEVKFSVVHEPLYHYVQKEDSSVANKLFENDTFIYRPAYERILKINQKEYVMNSYNSILNYSMYILLKDYKVQKSSYLLKQIRFIQHEMKCQSNTSHSKSKRRFAYEHAPILYSHFLK